VQAHADAHARDDSIRTDSHRSDHGRLSLARSPILPVLVGVSATVHSAIRSLMSGSSQAHGRETESTLNGGRQAMATVVHKSIDMAVNFAP
jgi:hypothetical protein